MDSFEEPSYRRYSTDIVPEEIHLVKSVVIYQDKFVAKWKIHDFSKKTIHAVTCTAVGGVSQELCLVCFMSHERCGPKQTPGNHMFDFGLAFGCWTL